MIYVYDIHLLCTCDMDCVPASGNLSFNIINKNTKVCVIVTEV